MGRLGVPLGKLVEIEGVYVAPPAQKGTEFAKFIKVRKLRGVVFPADLVLEIRAPYREVELGRVGEAARLIVFESGTFRGTPSEAFKYISPVADSKFGFYLFLVCVAVEGK